ncbi:MAG: hypothetical protein DRP56_03050 [Planctomycetota bacterium]|nr:MAG: hypothetical protein DRP56_03050 [Planctomycetota bacterium]RKY11708.1 MAG: hypothetical protein DRP52_05555 [Planctomycetota bacterium]
MKNEKSKPNETPSSTGFWLWGLGAVAMGVLGGVCILFWYTPRSYKPVRPENTEQASVYLTHELGPELFSQIQRNKPFELIVSQSGLNDIIGRWDWPQQFGEMSFSDPHVIFSSPSILLMGTLTYEGVSSVVSITALPVMNPDGTININIQSVRLGMVPVTTLVTKLAQKAFDENQIRFDGDLKAAETVGAIIRNEPFDPVFWFPDYWMRVSKLSIEPGSVKLGFLPEES